MPQLALRLAASICWALTFVCLLGAQTPTVTYVFDELGRLVGVIAPNGEAANYTYDGVASLLSIVERRRCTARPAHKPIRTLWVWRQTILRKEFP